DDLTTVEMNRWKRGGKPGTAERRAIERKRRSRRPAVTAVIRYRRTAVTASIFPLHSSASIFRSAFDRRWRLPPSRRYRLAQERGNPNLFLQLRPANSLAPFDDLPVLTRARLAVR